MNEKRERQQEPEEPPAPESGALIELPDEAVLRLEGEVADLKDK